ncbi:MAG: Kae1-associated kinase Bud32 [Thaumarchaeota archaeon 13_1_40CM_38_12]|nr:MAG: Kae1-associated kinase Bud32 [Thaumarchaeota archaeon 13_1_40CM_38_12]OLC36746.1 MAG: Kae1-associated kinase Bud32 [Thaumarchaeota archaeon 13_1_40CM_4_38_7]OLC94570.1 MAG: Kae1-associated kinase Bud32 [Thaumarchaeota archaeon 13_1_40CM_3_38_6]OLD41102.1 MAG: Kae1-associated kinase Bud32 [Thaumarchaeota archaeon 13_1_40CM_2_39_4]OLE39146.1 MAG: Kae1-associated kinase Bud32 [Thaumarchaeota archaeon 13_1_20CM_2_38_5]TLY03059.1 MAG: Kae1-associated serine/threonine protein kinase [Nitroso
MKLLKRGAEADIYLTTWNGMKSILKIRKKKDYRNEILDTRIRTLRTIREAKMISEVKSFGVSTPLIYFVNQKKCEIFLQYVSGKLVKDLPGNVIIKICKEIGRIVGILHKNGIMHGDLTTSNFILTKERLIIMDFGLAQKTEKVEDHAIDLRLFKEVLNSAHVDIVGKSWQSFLHGYKKIVGGTRMERVIAQVSVIEKRGRYANVV